MFDSFKNMNYTESYRVWYIELVEKNGLAVDRKNCIGETDNLDRAEAVEMFLWENGYEGTLIETLRVYENGDVSDGLFSSKRPN